MLLIRIKYVSSKTLQILTYAALNSHLHLYDFTVSRTLRGPYFSCEDRSLECLDPATSLATVETWKIRLRKGNLTEYKT